MDNSSSLAVTYDLKQKNPGGSSQFGSQFLHTCLYISGFGANNVHVPTLKQSRDFTGEDEAGAHGYIGKEEEGTQDQTRLLHMYLYVEGTST